MRGGGRLRTALTQVRRLKAPPAESAAHDGRSALSLLVSTAQQSGVPGKPVEFRHWSATVGGGHDARHESGCRIAARLSAYRRELRQGLGHPRGPRVRAAGSLPGKRGTTHARQAPAGVHAAGCVHRHCRRGTAGSTSRTSEPSLAGTFIAREGRVRRARGGLAGRPAHSGRIPPFGDHTGTARPGRDRQRGARSREHRCFARPRVGRSPISKVTSTSTSRWTARTVPDSSLS